MGRKIYFLSLVVLMACSAAWAESESPDPNERPYAFAEDLQGKKLEDLLVYSKENTVTPEEKKEKPIPLKAAEFIKIEKVKRGIPGADRTGEGYYSVRLKNSKELLALKNRFSLNINAELGVIVRQVDPAQSFFRKDPSSVASLGTSDTLIRDKTFFLGLELKF